MSKNIYLTRHAFERLQQHGIAESELTHCLDHGKTIEEYHDDKPYPSRLICLEINEDYLHVVAAYDKVGDTEIIITCYRPDPHLWNECFTQRKVH